MPRVLGISRNAQGKATVIHYAGGIKKYLPGHPNYKKDSAGGNSGSLGDRNTFVKKKAAPSKQPPRLSSPDDATPIPGLDAGASVFISILRSMGFFESDSPFRDDAEFRNKTPEEILAMILNQAENNRRTNPDSETGYEEIVKDAWERYKQQSKTSDPSEPISDAPNPDAGVTNQNSATPDGRPVLGGGPPPDFSGVVPTPHDQKPGPVVLGGGPIPNINPVPGQSIPPNPPPNPGSASSGGDFETPSWMIGLLGLLLGGRQNGGNGALSGILDLLEPSLQTLVTNSILGDEGDRLNDLLDDVFPGTNPWERLSGNTGVGSVAGQSTQQAMGYKIAEVQAQAQRDVATINAEPQHRNAEVNEFLASARNTLMNNQAFNERQIGIMNSAKARLSNALALAELTQKQANNIYSSLANVALGVRGAMQDLSRQMENIDIEVRTTIMNQARELGIQAPEERTSVPITDRQMFRGLGPQ